MPPHPCSATSACSTSTTRNEVSKAPCRVETACRLGLAAERLVLGSSSRNGPRRRLHALLEVAEGLQREVRHLARVDRAHPTDQAMHTPMWRRCRRRAVVMSRTRPCIRPSTRARPLAGDGGAARRRLREESRNGSLHGSNEAKEGNGVATCAFARHHCGHPAQRRLGRPARRLARRRLDPIGIRARQSTAVEGERNACRPRVHLDGGIVVDYEKAKRRPAGVVLAADGAPAQSLGPAAGARDEADEVRWELERWRWR